MPLRKPRTKPAARVPDVHVHLAPDAEGAEGDDETAAESDATAATERVRELTRDIDQRTVVKLYRSHPSLGGRQAFLTEIDPETFTEDMVGNLYGGGRYKAEFFGPIVGKGGKPGRGPIRTVVFEVDLSIPPKSPATGAVQNADGTPAGGAAGGGRLDMVLESGIISLFQQMQTANQQNALMVQRMMETTARPAMEWGPVLAALSPIMVAVVESFARRPDPMQAAREIAELATTKANPMQDMRAMLETLREFRSLSGEGGGEANDGTPPWLRVLERTAGPLLARAMAHDATASGMAPGGASDVSLPAGGESPQYHAVSSGDSAPAPLPSIPGSASVSPAFAFIAPVVPNLVQWAQQGRAPEWAAETLLYDVPPGLHPMMLSRLQPADIVPQLVAQFPALAPFEGWLTDFRGALVRQLVPDDDDGKDT